MISFKKTINEDVDVIYELSKDLILKYLFHFQYQIQIYLKL